LTDRIALWLFLIVAAGVVADLTLNEGRALLYLAQDGLALVEWVVFWR
jgi:hypothetical protein